MSEKRRTLDDVRADHERGYTLSFGEVRLLFERLDEARAELAKVTVELADVATIAESRKVKYEHLRFLIESHNATCRMACNGSDFLIRMPDSFDLSGNGNHAYAAAPEAGPKP